MGSMRIFLILIAIAMITRRVGSACLKIKLKRFENKWSTMQSAGRVGCCDRSDTLLGLDGGWLTDRRGLSSCRRFEWGPVHNSMLMIDGCENTFAVTPSIGGVVTGATGWAGTVFGFPSVVEFGDMIGNIDNNNIYACGDLQRKSLANGNIEYVMPDVDLQIAVNELDYGGNDNDFVTHFEAKIHPMRFLNGNKRICLSAIFLNRRYVAVSASCHSAPYWIDVDLHMEFQNTTERSWVRDYPSTMTTNGPYCETVSGSIYGCHA